jgi:fructokinase
MRIGIDLGGTKIEGVVLDAAGNERLRRRIATPAGDYAGTLAAIAGLVAELEGTCGRVDGIGVGIPGTVSRQTGLVKNANATWLNGRPLDRDLTTALARPVAVANDANCFAISEAIDGAGQGADVVFGVILGTGVGGGIVAHGRLIEGANGIGGEWGHNPLPWPLPWPLPRPGSSDESPGPACYCGRRGCIETFLSGPGLAARFREATGRTATAAEIAAAAAAGDRDADAALARYEHRLARALASVINVVDPDVIVLGGGLSNVARLYDAVPRLWGAFVFSDAVATRMVRNRFGDSSGVRGAARLDPPTSPGT